MDNYSLFKQQVSAENELSRCAQFFRRYQDIIYPFYEQQAIHSEFFGRSNVKISCCEFIPSNPVANVILNTGYNESYLKYAEVIFDLYNLGIAVYCFDHRGQGYSGRFPEQEKIAYIDKFAHYVDDFYSFVHTMVAVQYARLPTFVIAHSMGGAITLLALKQQRLPVNGVVLLSPLCEVIFTPWHVLETPVYWLAQLACLVGLGMYPVRRSDFTQLREFATNDVTHSFGRFSVWSEHILANSRMQLQGPSFAWIKEVVPAVQYLRHSQLNSDISVLLLQAEQDKVVRNSAQDTFVRRNRWVQKIVIPYAKHELLLEVDPIRNQVMRYIKDFILKD